LRTPEAAGIEAAARDHFVETAFVMAPARERLSDSAARLLLRMATLLQ